LVYSVCSLEPQEGEEIVQAFVGRQPGFRIAAPIGLPDFVPVSPEGWVRILPGLLETEGGLDGFFMARLVRAG
jgi:16S rRNA (cytosine967-C5)-methyltransferase